MRFSHRVSLPLCAGIAAIAASIGLVLYFNSYYRLVPIHRIASSMLAELDYSLAATILAGVIAAVVVLWSRMGGAPRSVRLCANWIVFLPAATSTIMFLAGIIVLQLDMIDADLKIDWLIFNQVYAEKFLVLALGWFLAALFGLLVQREPADVRHDKV